MVELLESVSSACLGLKAEIAQAAENKKQELESLVLTVEAEIRKIDNLISQIQSSPGTGNFDPSEAHSLRQSALARLLELRDTRNKANENINPATTTDPVTGAVTSGEKCSTPF